MTLLREERGFLLNMKKTLCYYFGWLVLTELLVTLEFGILVTNMHPYWLQLLSFPLLPLADLVSIVIWCIICIASKRGNSEKPKSV
jgi:hypothetical protein